MDKAVSQLKSLTHAEEIARFTIRGFSVGMLIMVAIDLTGIFKVLSWIVVVWMLITLVADYNKVMQRGESRFTILDPNKK